MTAPHRRPAAIRRRLATVGPAAGAVVMGTAIVSVALSLDGHEVLSRVLLAVAGVAWAGLAGLAALRVALAVAGGAGRRRLRDDLRRPSAFNAVAATAVVGTRLTMLGAPWAGGALLAVAFALWLPLTVSVLGHWRTPTAGASFTVVVGTESVAVLSAVVAGATAAAWLVWASLALCLLGIGLYLFVARRFDPRQLAVGRGDHWVTGGALAISTVAAVEIVAATERLGMVPELRPLLEGAVLVLWAATVVWLPVLVAVEIVWPRLRYDLLRWATVFPVGMYAACTLAVGTVEGVPTIAEVGRIAVWIAVAVWTAVATGLVRTTFRTCRRARRGSASSAASKSADG